MKNNTLSHHLMECLTAVTLCSGMSSPTFSAKAVSLLDEYDRRLYTIYLDENLVGQEYTGGEEPMQLASDPRNAEDWRGWHHIDILG